MHWWRTHWTIAALRNKVYRARLKAQQAVKAAICSECGELWSEHTIESVRFNSHVQLEKRTDTDLFPAVLHRTYDVHCKFTNRCSLAYAGDTYDGGHGMDSILHFRIVTRPPLRSFYRLRWWWLWFTAPSFSMRFRVHDTWSPWLPMPESKLLWEVTKPS